MSDKIKAIVRGYFTRKYKKDFPLEEVCDVCSLDIKGKIHRQETNEDNSESILYFSSVRQNKGITSLSSENITYAKKVHNKYLCENCQNFNNNYDYCSICMCHGFVIKTKCNHKFHKKCLIDWIKHDNICNETFKATCPYCRQLI